MPRIEVTGIGRIEDVVRIADVDYTAVPEAGKVRLRLIAAPINPADLLTIDGRYGVIPPPPFTPGSEATARVVAVGTTALRALEAASGAGALQAGEGETDIFIYPGYQFRQIDALVTNFHLPRSTLLMLISAFAGRDRVMAAYQAAIDERYRFFSYGDAMFIERAPDAGRLTPDAKT